jgi:ParB/RepB/Spo0J family partition protein
VTEQYQVRDVPLANITPGDNDRQDYDPRKLQELADSIDENGLHQPIVLRELLAGQYEIVAGHRRYFACELLGRETIPAMIRDLNDEAAAAVMWEENDQREGLNPIDQARAIQKRMDAHGYSAEEVADKIRRSPSFVRDRLRLLALKPNIQHLVARGQLKIGYALAMCELDGNRQQIAVGRLVDYNPNLEKFRRVCGELLAEQAQEALFDWDAFMQEAIAEEEAVEERKEARRFPVDESLPEMQGAMTVGLAMERYLAQLVTSGDPSHQAAAAVVGRVYEGLLNSHLAHRPDESPLDEVTNTCPPTAASE